MSILVAFMIGACIGMIIFDIGAVAWLIWDNLVNG